MFDAGYSAATTFAPEAAEGRLAASVRADYHRRHRAGLHHRCGTLGCTASRRRRYGRARDVVAVWTIERAPELTAADADSRIAARARRVCNGARRADGNVYRLSSAQSKCERRGIARSPAATDEDRARYERTSVSVCHARTASDAAARSFRRADCRPADPSHRRRDGGTRSYACAGRRARERRAHSHLDARYRARRE